MKHTKIKYLVLDKNSIKEFMKSVRDNTFNDINEARFNLEINRKEGQRWLFSIKQRGFSVKDKIDLATYHIYKIEGVE